MADGNKDKLWLSIKNAVCEACLPEKQSAKYAVVAVVDEKNKVTREVYIVDSRCILLKDAEPVQFPSIDNEASY